MPRPDKLTAEALAEALLTLPDWTLVDGKLRRELRYPDFVAAFGFMTRVALVAERLDHHPEWSNVYGTVRIELVTHDCAGVSERDVALARRIDALA